MSNAATDAREIAAQKVVVDRVNNGWTVTVWRNGWAQTLIANSAAEAADMVHDFQWEVTPAPPPPGPVAAVLGDGASPLPGANHTRRKR